jgi:hypothetical protein
VEDSSRVQLERFRRLLESPLERMSLELLVSPKKRGSRQQRTARMMPRTAIAQIVKMIGRELGTEVG